VTVNCVVVTHGCYAQGMANFDNDTQALLTGMFLGLLMKKGISARPEVDADGNYTPIVFVEMETGAVGESVHLAVQVLP
jgi:hypothetical protein